MWKIVVGFVIFAAMVAVRDHEGRRQGRHGGEKHGADVHAPAAPAAPASAPSKLKRDAVAAGPPQGGPRLPLGGWRTTRSEAK